MAESSAPQTSPASAASAASVASAASDSELTCVLPLPHTLLLPPDSASRSSVPRLTTTQHGSAPAILYASPDSLGLWKPHRPLTALELGPLASQAGPANHISELVGDRLYMDNLGPILETVSRINGSSETTNLKAGINTDGIRDGYFSVHLSGPPAAVNAERSHLLRQYLQVSRIRFGTQADILESTASGARRNIRSELRSAVDTVAQFYGVSIFVTNFLDTACAAVNPAYQRDFLSASAAAEKFHFYVYGDQDAARRAAVALEVALDETLLGKFVDYVKVELSRVPFVMGCNSVNIRNITAQTQCKLYLPSLMPEVFDSLAESRNLEEQKEEEIGTNPDCSSNSANSGNSARTDGFSDVHKTTADFAEGTNGTSHIPEASAHSAGSNNGNAVSCVPNLLNSDVSDPTASASASASASGSAPPASASIFLSGTPEAVATAKCLIREILCQKTPYFRDAVLSLPKIDFLLLHCQAEIEELMERFGAFVQLPFLGAGRAIVRIQALSEDLCRKTAEELMRIVCVFYKATCWPQDGLDGNFNGTSARSVNSYPPSASAQYSSPSFLSQVASTGCFVSHRGGALEVVGTATAVKRAVSRLQSSSSKLIIQLELAREQKEFLAGKKNGKLLRIINATQANIRFEPFNEYNCYVQLAADSPQSAATALSMLEDEMPAETAFYIPETCHKQIIGTGGQLIQLLMRKYNVFIKFSTQCSFTANGYSHSRMDNVVIRCPAKNAAQIPLAKQELLERVQHLSDEQYNTFLRVSAGQQRILLMTGMTELYKIEKTSGTHVIYPCGPPTEEQIVEIRGPGRSSEEAAELLKNLLASQFEFRISYAPQRFAECVLDSREFQQRFAVPARVCWKIETTIYTSPLKQTHGGFHRILLACPRDGPAEYPSRAMELLTAYLREKELDILDKLEILDDPVEPGTAASAGSAVSAVSAGSAVTASFSAPPSSGSSLSTGPFGYSDSYPDGYPERHTNGHPGYPSYGHPEYYKVSRADDPTLGPVYPPVRFDPTFRSRDEQLYAERRDRQLSPVRYNEEFAQYTEGEGYIEETPKPFPGRFHGRDNGGFTGDMSIDMGTEPVVTGEPIYATDRGKYRNTEKPRRNDRPGRRNNPRGLQGNRKKHYYTQ